jgi:hypothetical protein
MEAWTCPHRYAAALQAGTDEMRRGARPLLAAILRSSSATPLAVQGRTTTEDTEHTEGHGGSSFVVLRSWFIRLLLLPVQVSDAPPSKIRNQKSAFSNRVFPRAPNEVVRDSARGSRQDNHGRHGTHGRAQRFFVRSSGFASRLRSSPFYRKQVHRKSSDNRRGQRFFVRSSGLSPCLVQPIPAQTCPQCYAAALQAGLSAMLRSAMQAG